MATNLDWFSRTITDIIHGNNVVNNLSEFKIALTSLNSAQLKYIASNIQLAVIFDCLNSSDKNQINLACEILKTLLPVLDARTVLMQYGVPILRASTHPEKDVKILVLNELYRAVCDRDLSSKLSQEETILLSIIECVGDESVSVSKISVSFLVRFGMTVSNLNVLYSRPLLKALNEVKAKNDIVRFRVYEIVVEISASSVPGLEASHESGLLMELVLEVKQSDILAKLTALEALTKLALTHHGLEYLERHMVTVSLVEEIIKSKNDSLSSLLLPGLLKFFGNVAQLRPKHTFDKYPQVIAAVFDALESSDRSLSGVAMETVGYVATTPDGKLCLQKYDDAMNHVMNRLKRCISSDPTEFRVRALNTVANLIHLEVDDQNSELLELTQKWFSKLSENPILQIMDLCRQPFPEIKLAGFLILQNIAYQVWGQHQINNCPGLIEFLMDRNVEPTLQCKTEKFKVVEILAGSHTAASVFGEVLHRRLQDFVKDGPCFVHTLTEVAIEGAS